MQFHWKEVAVELLQLKNVTLRLKKDGRSIAEDFSFTLKSGEKAVMIGEEGNGKSTLLKYLVDPRLVEPYCECSGEVVKKGRIAYLPQMLAAQDRARTLLDYFGDTEYYRFPDVLAKLGLSVDFLLSQQTLGTLSGGERVKVQLARLLMDEPDVLLLDEPTNDLDIPTLCWLETFLAQSKLPILFISHDETLIEKTANVIVHMEQIIRKTKCRISVSRCSYRDYLAFRRNLFDHQEQVARDQREHYDRQMETWRRIYSRVEHEQAVITRADPGGGRLLKKKMHTTLSMKKRFEREKEAFLDFPEEETAILTRFDETIRIPNGKTVLDFTCDRLCVGTRTLAENVRLFVAGNERVGITGRNGVGKSTLLARLWQELAPRRDLIAARMPQDYSQALDFEKTPIEYLAAHYSKEEITRARTYLGSMKFTHEEMTGSIGRLSGGQQAKLLFLDMVLRGANVLLLDEPTRNFSPLSCPVVRAALCSFGGAIISVSHDRKYLREVCTKVYELRPDGLFPVDSDRQ